MTPNLEYLGLCSNCLSAPECSYRKRHSAPVLFCEEFTYEKAAPGTPFNEITSVKKNNSIENIKEYKGLCINCENRNDCSAEQVRSGIVHCNLYEIEKWGMYEHE